MKKVLIKTLIVCVVVLLLPFILTMLFAENNEPKSREAMDFSIYYLENGAKDKISFDDYLIGVLAANMPAGYEMEALKAQAVIARTYAMYNVALLEKDDPDKTTFTTSELGLSYLSLDSLEKFWGKEDYNNFLTKLENAVYDTNDKVLVYDDKLIFPAFFSTGSGFTRNASEAWGIDIPYLTSVSSKQDVTSTDYLHIQEFAVADLISLLEKYYTDIDLSKDKFFDEVKVSSRDSTGYALKVNLGKKTVSGEEFAKVTGLSSNHFYIEEYENKARVICNGSGHGVGLSQYGANAMAEEGSDYTDILKHYYTGVSLSSLSE